MERNACRWLGAALAVGAAALLGGCANFQSGGSTAGSGRATAVSPDDSAADDEGVAASAEAHAARLAEAIARSTDAKPGEDGAGAMPNDAPRGASAAGRAADAGGVSFTESLAELLSKLAAAIPADAAMTQAAAAPVAEPALLSRSELLAQLVEQIRQEGSSALTEALAGAALSAAAMDGRIDPRLLAPLDPEQRQLVERYQQVLVRMQRELAEGSAELDAAAVRGWLDELFGQPPVEIRHLALCRRVSGYGVYEPFESTTFLAGRDQKMIVYVELDHFRAVERTSSEYEVRLEQEVVLYNEADGLAVWRHEPVQIVDVSRNRRRDFFVVQLITLPARLTVGKYRLKVRITDTHGGSIDETTTRLEIVADPALVGR